MRINWQQRLSVQPELWDIEKWPHLISTDLPVKKQRTFLQNRQIVAKVLSHQPTHKICLELNVSKSKVSKLLTRCLAGDDSMDPPLTKGLIPGVKITTPERRAALSTLELKKGTTCCFSYLLNNVKGLQEYLDKVLLNHLHDRPESEQLKLQNFFSHFINYLSTHNWPKNTYPFTELNAGKESVRRYMNHRLIELQQSILIKKSLDQEFLPALTKRAFSEIQIDEHKYDAMCTVIIELNGVQIELRVDRITLILAVDVATFTRLSYVIVLHRAPDHYDFLECIARIYRPWKETKILTPGISYGLNSAFAPGNLFGASDAPVIGEISLDNAMIHHAHNVRSFIVNTMAGNFHTGKPARPKDRNWVEYAIKQCADHAHRFRSTTGSHVNDTIKESAKNWKKTPVVNLRTLEETIEVTLAAENAKQRAHLGSLSPLQMMELNLTQHYIPRYSREQIEEITRRLISKVVPIIHSRMDSRPPHINFCYCKYKGNCLAREELINQKITIVYNPNDIRTVTAYFQGKFLGVLTAPKVWRSFPHSIKTRKIIHHLVRRGIIKHVDPLTGYFYYVLQKKANPKFALEIIRLSREFNQLPIDASSDAPQHNTYQSLSDEPLSSENVDCCFEDEDFPEWTPEFSDISQGGQKND